jgi:hypothetical protein
MLVPPTLGMSCASLPASYVKNDVGTSWEVHELIWAWSVAVVAGAKLRAPDSSHATVAYRGVRISTCSNYAAAQRRLFSCTCQQGHVTFAITWALAITLSPGD